MISKQLILALLASSLLFSEMGWAQAKEEPGLRKPAMSYKYYDVDATVEDNIVDNAFKATPIRIGGKRFLGQAKCGNGFEYEGEKGDSGSCRLKDFSIDLHCEVTLPRFVGAGEATKPKLAAFMERLEFHEQNHCDYFTGHSNDFIKWLTEDRKYGCNSMSNNIRTAFNKMNNELEAFQKKYDKDTLHGRIEGADLEWHLATAEERLLMGEDVVAPAVQVAPEVKYSYFDVEVNSKTGNWRHVGGSFGWSLSNSYKPRRKIDETCRVMKYEVKAACEIGLPRFKGGDESLQPELAARVEEIKTENLNRCNMVAGEADKFAERISGKNTFHCDRMKNEVTAQMNVATKNIKDLLKHFDLETRVQQDSEETAGVISPTVEYKYYDVSLKQGERPFEAALKEKAFRRGQDKSYPSAIEWKMAYEFAGRTKADESCRVGGYEIKYTCAIHLPRFKSADPALQAKGEALSGQIKNDELIRCGMIKTQAEEFGRWLSADQSFPCGSMSNRVNGKYQSIFKACKEALEKYDLSKAWAEPGPGQGN